MFVLGFGVTNDLLRSVRTHRPLMLQVVQNTQTLTQQVFDVLDEKRERRVVGRLHSGLGIEHGFSAPQIGSTCTFYLRVNHHSCTAAITNGS
jgi:hypothetical protein